MNLAIAGHIETILVDYFDTLVERSCHPEVVKRKWAAAVSDAWGSQIDSEALYALRLKIEAGLCNSSTFEGLDAEFRYEDMLFILYHQLLKKNLCARLPAADEFLAFCRATEVAIELWAQRPVEPMAELLRAEQKKGKKIYLVSDFYLDKKAITQFVGYHGLADIFSGIYVSSERKRTKKEGGIYDDIIAELQLNIKKTLMLGDNLHSDVTVPQSKGLLAWHLPADIQYYQANLRADLNRRAVNQQLQRLFREDSYNFNWVGGAIYLFIRRLYWKLAVERADNVYFFSREGEFLQQAFNQFQSSLPEGYPRIASHYLLVSRRATYLPSLKDCNLDSFKKFLNQYCSCSLAVFIKSINMDEHLEEFKGILPGVDFNEQHVNISVLPGFNKLINHQRFIALFKQERDKQKASCLQYYNEIIKEKHDAVIHVVDVGWKGSIQDNLVSIMQRPIHGYYFGVLEGADCTRNNIKKGLLFDLQQGDLTGNPLFNEFRAGFEVFMSASHGSVKRYEDGKIQYDKNQVEQDIFRRYILPFQQRTLQLFERFAHMESYYSLSDKDICRAVSRVYFSGVMLPNSFEVELFPAIRHYENFGGFHFSRFGTPDRSRLAYLKDIIKRPYHTFGSSWWKPLDFHAYGVSCLKYPYMLFKKIKYLRFV